MLAAPALASGGSLLAMGAFVFSALAVTGMILTAGLAMFPFIMPSSTDPRSSVIADDSEIIRVHARALGYVLKDDAADLEAALHRAIAGQRFASRGVLAEVDETTFALLRECETPARDS